MEEEIVRMQSKPLSTCSATSLLPHCSSEGTVEHQNDLKAENNDTGNKNGRARKLLQKYNLLLPELKGKKDKNVADKVDLSIPTDTLDPWLIRKFPAIKKKVQTIQESPEKAKKLVPASRRIKEDLLAKMAIKRKAEQERRKELYAEDNEDIFGSKEEDEDQIFDEEEKNKKKTKLKAKKPVGSDEEDEDDEDFVAEDVNDEEESNSDEEASDRDGEDKNADKQPFSLRNSLKESVDVFDLQNSPQGVTLESEPNIFNQSQPIMASQFPSSLTQWYLSDADTNKEESFLDEEEEAAQELKETVKNDPVNNDDLLAFCSGQFEPPTKTIKKIEEEDNIEEDIIHSSKKKKRVLDSDDEDEQEKPVGSELDKDEEPPSPIKETEKRHKNVIISDDEEDEVLFTKKKFTEDEANEEEEEDADDEMEDEAEEEEEEEEEPEPAAQEGNDSDDELAVIRRLENQDHKRKLKKKKFVDDEASLSGSDVGSDLDEEDAENDVYEADECDNEIFDQDELKDKNHKLYLKLQQQQVHRDIAKLQDRLLADGDLAGVETNRSFRVRLREDVEIDMDAVNAPTQFSLFQDDENPEEDKSRLEAIKFRAEMHNVISQLQEEPIDDDLERAAREAELLKVDEPIYENDIERAARETDFLEVSEQTEYEETVTLIGKAPLANVFKDVNGPVAVRQMYTTTVNVSAPCKRSSGAVQMPSKKQKLTLFDVLDD